MKCKTLMTVAICMAAGCGGSEEKKAAVQMGPEETVEAFCRTMAAGGFEDAMALCDTMTMKQTSRSRILPEKVRKDTYYI